MTNYDLWRGLNIHHRQNGIKFPIPPCARIIPMQHSYWNSTKGGSDHTTYLLSQCKVKVGKTKFGAQLVPFTRTIQLFGVLCHRFAQMLTSRDDLDYPSLYHYRNAASARRPFHKTCEDLSAFLCRMVAPTSVPRTLQSPPPPLPKRRITRAISRFFTPTWARYNKTGATPGKKGLRKKDKNKPLVGREEHENRARRCPGIPMKRLDPKTQTKAIQKRCTLCGLKTTWFCMGCKRNLCMGEDRHERLIQMVESKDNTMGTLTSDHVCLPVLLKQQGLSTDDEVTENAFQWLCYHCAL